ncbi:hypothetical protein BD414DRAFT_146556 [Trametes punicea]|nr:hypothetical protein BD414DRAFT_146556 [Trametes punicea]
METMVRSAADFQLRAIDADAVDISSSRVKSKPSDIPLLRRMLDICIRIRIAPLVAPSNPALTAPALNHPVSFAVEPHCSPPPSRVLRTSATALTGRERPYRPSACKLTCLVRFRTRRVSSRSPMMELCLCCPTISTRSRLRSKGTSACIGAREALRVVQCLHTRWTPVATRGLPSASLRATDETRPVHHPLRGRGPCRPARSPYRIPEGVDRDHGGSIHALFNRLHAGGGRCPRPRGGAAG